MFSRNVKKSLILLGTILLIGSLAEGNDVEILSLNSPADLDFSGDILYAVNFGDNGNPIVGDFLFLEDEEFPSITLIAEGEGPATWWGPSPGTGDANLNQLLNWFVRRWRNALPLVFP